MYKESSNQKQVKTKLASFKLIDNVLTLEGAWVWSAIDENEIKRQLKNIPSLKTITINGQDISSLDTVGVYFIDQIITFFTTLKTEISAITLAETWQSMFDQIYCKIKQPSTPQASNSQKPQLIGIIKFWKSQFATFLDFVTFFGHFCFSSVATLIRIFSLNWDEVVRTVNEAGLKGLGVVVLLSFLIGVTLAYEMSPQFSTYGANVYIVNFLGISLLKEVSPLLTAVIVAGRSGAAITAEIGTQKVQEEIDALTTMGISPIKRIVLPKVLGVMIALPLITALGDIASMAGGALVAKPMLGVSYSLFINRMQTYVSIHNYSCGIIKSVAFALLIALCGCFCGFNVKGNANSIGEETTRSVVWGIICVVLCDAIFAIIFNVLGW